MCFTTVVSFKINNTSNQAGNLKQSCSFSKLYWLSNHAMVMVTKTIITQFVLCVSASLHIKVLFKELSAHD